MAMKGVTDEVDGQEVKINGNLKYAIFDSKTSEIS